MLTLLLLTVLASTDDSALVEETIATFVRGIDEQDGDPIAKALASDAAIFGTNANGSGLITVTAEQFAELHASGRFGGDTRELAIEYLDVTDGLVATAKAVAANDDVHYTYYFGLVKLGGVWSIQTVLQRSRTH